MKTITDSINLREHQFQIILDFSLPGGKSKFCQELKCLPSRLAANSSSSSTVQEK